MANVYIKKNEATAARRRAFFHLVDLTDGMTPETAEAGGQPQISVDGAAWTNTGIGVLVAIGNGRYYAELTQAIVNVDDAVIETRFKSAATQECPGSTAITSIRLDRLDAAVTTRNATAPDNAGITAIKDTVNHATYGNAKLALASVATEARLAELDAANLPAVTDAISAKTTNLPTDPADESLSVARAEATDALITTLQATAMLILKWLKNWIQVVMSGGTGTLVLKDDDDTTVIATQTITDLNATDGTVTRTRGV